MQKSVVRAIHTSVEEDPLGEAETALALDDHMKSLQICEEERRNVLGVLQDWGHHTAQRADREFELEREQAEVIVEVPLIDEGLEPSEQPEEPPKKKRGGQAAARTEKLGDDPRLNRSIIRASLAPGFYVCFSGKRNIRTLHKLGLCYALPEVDYIHYEYAGSTLPPVAAYDTVCKLCARKNILNADVSEGSVTSSSTEEEE